MVAPAARSLPYPLGFSRIGGRFNFALYSETAETVYVSTFDARGTETRTRLQERTGHVFHGFIDSARHGARYGIRVDGAWNPAEGLRHNVNKLLLDPYATAIEGDYSWGQAVFGHKMDEPEERDDCDSVSAAPRCVLTDPAFDWGDDTAPRTLCGTASRASVRTRQPPG
jgi:isoamylase